MVNITAPKGHHVLVLAPYFYGRAKTFKEAYENCKKAGANTSDLRRKNYMIHFVPEDRRVVDDLGNYYYHQDCDVCQCLYKPDGKQDTKQPANFD